MNIPFIFSVVLKSTIFGSVVGIIIFILKSTLLKKLSSGWQYWLWSVMILKLIFPNGPESNISVFNKINLPQTASDSGLVVLSQKTSSIPQTAFTASDVISYIWFIGFILAILWIGASFCIMNYKIRKSSLSVSDKTLEVLNTCRKITGIKRHIEPVVQNHVPTTALSGIIKPKILITKAFEGSGTSHMEYSFIHELSHYKRGDVAVNYLLLFLRCVHWFNPVVWYLFSKIRRDTELATDEKTMLYLAPAEHKDYGMALINTVSANSHPIPNLLGMANNKQDIKKRIKAIAKFKKPGFIQHISGILTVILIASVCLTGAVIAKPISDIIYQSLPVSEALVTKNSTFVLSPVIEKSDKAEKSVESLAEEAASVTKDISETQNLPPVSERNPRYIHYNTDSQAFYTFKTKPDSMGQLQLLIEKNSQYEHQIEVDISSIHTPGRGWSYTLYSGSGEVHIIDGLNPETEYYVTVNTFCPGYYGINGIITVY